MNHFVHGDHIPESSEKNLFYAKNTNQKNNILVQIKLA